MSDDDKSKQDEFERDLDAEQQQGFERRMNGPPIGLSGGKANYVEKGAPPFEPVVAGSDAEDEDEPDVSDLDDAGKA